MKPVAAERPNVLVVEDEHPKVLTIAKPYDAPVPVSALATIDVHPCEQSQAH